MQIPHDKTVAAKQLVAWRVVCLGVMPITMLISWFLRSLLWFGTPALWFMIANPAAILATLVSFGMLLRHNDRKYMNWCVLIFVGLMIASLLPVWFQHVGEPSEPDAHWHSYWSMAHVH